MAIAEFAEPQPERIDVAAGRATMEDADSPLVREASHVGRVQGLTGFEPGYIDVPAKFAGLAAAAFLAAQVDGSVAYLAKPMRISAESTPAPVPAPADPTDDALLVEADSPLADALDALAIVAASDGHYSPAYREADEAARRAMLAATTAGGGWLVRHRDALYLTLGRTPRMAVDIPGGAGGVRVAVMTEAMGLAGRG